jgi:hypothetical protein
MGEARIVIAIRLRDNLMLPRQRRDESDETGDQEIEE